MVNEKCLKSKDIKIGQDEGDIWERGELEWISRSQAELGGEGGSKEENGWQSGDTGHRAPR